MNWPETSPPSSHELLEGQNRLLEWIATGASLDRILDGINRLMERCIPGAIGSILLLDNDGVHLHLGAARGLPEAYNRAIDGVAIGPAVGSCGTAAYRREPVIVTDIATDPLWADYRHLTLPHGLRACWSTPIFSSEHQVLGTFALYYRHPRGPTDQDIWMVARLAHLAGVALQRRRTETALRDSEERLRLANEAAGIGTYDADFDTGQTLLSDQFCDLMALPRGTVLSLEASMAIVHPDERDAVALQFTQALDPAGSGRFRSEHRILRTDGQVRWLLVSGRIHFRDTPQGRVPCRGLGVCVDITHRKAAEEALFAEKERALVTLESIGDAVITTDAHGGIEYLNPVAVALTGWSLEQARGRRLQAVFPLVDQETRAPLPDPVSRVLAQGRVVDLSNHSVLIARDGKEYAVESSAAPIRDRNGTVLGTVLVFHDVSEQRRLVQEIAHQAAHDALTGLCNRREFERRLERVMDTTRHEGGEHALCYLDLDQFKVINDTCGHVAGDQLLRQLGNVLRPHIRYRDTLARLGGDEFGVLLEHCQLDRAQRVAHALRQAVEEFRFAWHDQMFRVGVSIGLVPITRTSGGKATVLQAADSACYVAKDAGRNRVHVYQENDRQVAHRHGELQWVSRLQQAIEQNRLRLHAQRIFPLNPSARQGLHCELLLRLMADDGRLTTPDSFIPAAERYHLASRIDRWVVDHAFEWLSGHPDLLARIDLCSINLSGQSLGDPGFHTFVLERLKDIQPHAGRICFEITETAAIANLAEASDFIETLKTQGCRFALDDFGSGLSSFAYLKRLPVDYLKIDGMFVKDIGSDPLDLAMVRSINEIAQLMGKRTIAEFVENSLILEKIRDLGVDYAQGYGVGRPVPLESLKFEV